MPSQKEIDAVWKAKAKDNAYCIDSKGNKIRRASYGKKTALGWEIDHKTPTAKGGKDTLKNKQPLQWKANRIKSDKITKKVKKK